MTIVTKPKTETKPLVKHEIENGECVVVDSKAAAAAGGVGVGVGVGEEDVWLASASGSRCRLSTATSICVCITVLLVMSIGIIGGVYLYRQFSAHERAHFRGWCGIPYNHEDLMRNSKLPIAGNTAMYTARRGMFKDDTMSGDLEENDAAEWLSKSMFNEEFELDLDGNDYEEIHVPDFGFRRTGRFIHDFKVNKTGIIDLKSRRCFVMPLDRSHVLPPRSVYDLLKKMWMGYYSVDTKVIRETMHVVGPPVKDYQPLGIYITKYCESYPTYYLEPHYSHDIKKRSVDQIEAEENEEGIHFAEFAGKNVVHLVILGAEDDLQ